MENETIENTADNNIAVSACHVTDGDTNDVQKAIESETTITDKKDESHKSSSNAKNAPPCHSACGEAAVKRLSQAAPPKFETFLILLTACGGFAFAPLYGFNVYIIPLLQEFSNSDDASSQLYMKDGSPVFVAGLAIFSLSLVNFVVAPKVSSWGFPFIFFLGICSVVVGLVLTFVAVEYHQLWLLYIGYGCVFGAGTGFTNLTLISNTILWFRAKLNAPGLGAGIFGFIAGMWPALFSYFGPALEDTVGIAYSFLILAIISAGLGWWVVFFLHSPQSIAFQPATNNDTTGDNNKAKNDSPPNARPDNAITAEALIRTKQFWLTAAVFFLACFPGFGVKLVVSPLLKGVFNASDAEQSAASSMFLASYAIARLVFGPVADRYHAKPLMLACLLCQSIVCIGLGVIVWYAAEGKTSVWAFAVVNMFLGITMAGIKVLFGVFLLTIFGDPSLSMAIGRLFIGMGLSAFIAPIAMWSVLVGAGENLNGDTGNTTGFTQSVALFFWASTAGSIVAVFLLLNIEPCRFEPLPSAE